MNSLWETDYTKETKSSCCNQTSIKDILATVRGYNGGNALQMRTVQGNVSDRGQTQMMDPSGCSGYSAARYLEVNIINK